MEFHTVSLYSISLDMQSKLQQSQTSSRTWKPGYLCIQIKPACPAFACHAHQL